jgi:hypothetical protein
LYTLIIGFCKFSLCMICHVITCALPHMGYLYSAAFLLLVPSFIYIRVLHADCHQLQQNHNQYAPWYLLRTTALWHFISGH